MIVWTVFTLMLMANVVTGGLEGKKAGPYRVIVNSIMDCPADLVGSNTIRLVDFQLEVYNRTTKIVKGNLEFDEELSDDCSGSVSLTQLTNSGIKENFFSQTVDGLCTAMDTYAPDIYSQFMKTLNVTECPIPPVHSPWVYPLAVNVKGITTFFYGSFYSDMSVQCRNERVGCIRFSMDIVPKTKRRG